MRKVIATMNITIDGYCDHTAMLADAELHEHYTELLTNAGALLYGRTTYQLMESFWPALVQKPSGDKHMDDFANAIENIPKIVFSNTLKDVGWQNVRLANRTFSEELSAIKEKPGNDILLGSPSLISHATNLDLVDEYQLCVHPVIAGKGLPLFRHQQNILTLQLVQTKTFHSGAVLFYYRSSKKA